MRLSVLAASGAALLAGGIAHAQPVVEISRAVFVERKAQVAGGKVMRALEPASDLRRGDHVVLMLEWSARAGDDGFVVSSRVPRDLMFRRSGEAEAEVSTDHGRTWGPLASLRIGNRRAVAEDVTHLRWRVSESDAAQGRGMLTYSAIVR
ncbi:hypothetical protein J4558_09920 [Leptolyngbya sp. 15MV]|nr:hypothetical protein J4558_09920 [Leptolyngbya sp. 15MV]